MVYATINRINGNAFSTMKVIYDSLKFMHKPIAKLNVWPISRTQNVDVCNFQCQASVTFVFVEFCERFQFPFGNFNLEDNRTKICGAAKVNCYQMAEKRLFGEDVMDGVKDDVVKLFREKCNCLPACTSIFYDADIDRAKLDWDAVLNTYKDREFHEPG